VRIYQATATTGRCFNSQDLFRFCSIVDKESTRVRFIFSNGESTTIPLGHMENETVVYENISSDG
jgi:hypothetical protein